MIVRRLFRVYAHIYSNHFDHICALGIEGIFRLCYFTLSDSVAGAHLAHLNTSYRHFFLFINEVSPRATSNLAVSADDHQQFDLVDKKELAPLDELNDAILSEDKTR